MNKRELEYSIRKLADMAWKLEFKDVSDKLHDIARNLEGENKCLEK
jgi:hypothetical protein